VEVSFKEDETNCSSLNAGWHQYTSLETVDSFSSFAKSKKCGFVTGGSNWSGMFLLYEIPAVAVQAEESATVPYDYSRGSSTNRTPHP
jgi:hypothetical protein